MFDNPKNVKRLLKYFFTSVVILLIIDKPLGLARRPLFIIQVHLPDDALDQPMLII